MTDTKRDVLERVARGELSPQEAAAILDGLAPAGAGGPEAPPRPGTGSPPQAPAGNGAARVRVVRSLGRLDIYGDAGVREAVADGPHVARREGDTLVIEGTEQEMDANWFGFDGRSWSFNRGRWNDDLRRPVTVRVNPDLPLEVRAQAGSVRIRGVRGPIQAQVQAGMTQIEDFAGPLDLSAQAGSIRASGRLTGGTSRVRCDAGSVFLDLEDGSDVRVTARATLGKVAVEGAVMTETGWVVGGGRATLDVDATMGSVRVQARS